MQGETTDEGQGAAKVAQACVYFIRAPSGYVKIGSARDPVERMNALQVGHHEKLDIMAAFECGDGIVPAVVLERTLHEMLAPLRIQGEWFKYDKRMFDVASRYAWIKCRYPEAWEFWWRPDGPLFPSSSVQQFES